MALTVNLNITALQQQTGTQHSPPQEIEVPNVTTVTVAGSSSQETPPTPIVVYIVIYAYSRSTILSPSSAITHAMYIFLLHQAINGDKN